MVTHSEAHAGRADRVVHMLDGRFVERDEEYPRMLQNYLAAAIRNLFRDRAYAAINIFGLALGFAAAILIGLFVRDELSYDRAYPHSERIFRLSDGYQRRDPHGARGQRWRGSRARSSWIFPKWSLRPG